MRRHLELPWAPSRQGTTAAATRDGRGHSLSRRRLITALPLCYLCGYAAGAQQIQRVVSVGGAVTEIVFALGAGERLVAADSTSIWPDAARQLPRVGYMRALSAEGVMAMKPDVVLATSDCGPPAVIAQLKAAGVKLAVLPAQHSLDSLRMNVKSVAAALALDQRGAELDARILADWNETQQSLAKFTTRPRVLFLLAHSGNNAMVAGQETGADAMIRLAGAVNAIGGFKGYKPLTAEAAIGAAPDVILIISEGLAVVGGVAQLLRRPGLALTPAGKTRRVLALDALFLLGFGPRLPQAVRELALQLHQT
jgi:heme transport system substrate-binding protein